MNLNDEFDEFEDAIDPMKGVQLEIELMASGDPDITDIVNGVINESAIREGLAVTAMYASETGKATVLDALAGEKLTALLASLAAQVAHGSLASTRILMAIYHQQKEMVSLMNEQNHLLAKIKDKPDVRKNSSNRSLVSRKSKKTGSA